MTGQKKYDKNVDFLYNILQKTAVYHWPAKKKQQNNKNTLGLYEKKTYRHSNVRTYPLHHIPAYNIQKLYVSLIKKQNKKTTSVCGYVTYSTQASYFWHDRPKKIQKKGQHFCRISYKNLRCVNSLSLTSKKNSKNDSLCHIFYKMQQFITERQTKTRKVCNFVMYSTL